MPEAVVAAIEYATEYELSLTIAEATVILQVSVVVSPALYFQKRVSILRRNAQSSSPT